MNVAPLVLFMLAAGSISGAAFATDSLEGAFQGQQQGTCVAGQCLVFNETGEPGNETSEPEEGNETADPEHRHSNDTAEPEPEHRHSNETSEPGEGNETSAHGGCPAYGLQEDGCSYVVEERSDLALHAGGYWSWEVLPSTESLYISIETDGLFGTDLFASQGTFMELVDGNGDVVASFSDSDLHLFEGQYVFELDLSKLDGLVLGEWSLWFEDCFLVGSYHIVIEVLCDEPEA